MFNTLINQTTMQKEKSVSLFLPLVTGFLLVFIFLSGIIEMACLVSYATKVNTPAGITNKTRTVAFDDGSASRMLSSVVVTVLPK